MVTYFAYTKEELAANPNLKDQYCNVGNRIWIKKVGSLDSKSSV